MYIYDKIEIFIQNPDHIIKTILSQLFSSYFCALLQDTTQKS